MEIIQNPHNKMFKRVFRVQENAVNLLRNILPAEINGKLDLEGTEQSESHLQGKKKGA